MKSIPELPAVEIVYSSVESNAPLVVQALQRAGVRGIVFAATGAGSLSDLEKQTVQKTLAQGGNTVFVRSSRVGNGRVIGRAEFDAMGIIAADNLSPQKARILLMLALATTSDPGTLSRMFSEY